MQKERACVRLKSFGISGGALTKGTDRATSMRTDGAIPLPAYTPPKAVEILRRLC
jgi:hypothetical protein